MRKALALFPGCRPIVLDSGPETIPHLHKYVEHRFTLGIDIGDHIRDAQRLDERVVGSLEQSPLSYSSAGLV